MKKVIVYSTPTCPWCIKAKEFLKKNQVEFVDKDILADHGAAKEMILKSGQRNVPVLDIDGKIILGFDEETIRESLGISS